MSSTLIKTVVFVGILATLAINVVAPRLGVTPAPPAPANAPAAYGGAKLVPPPPGMR